MEDLNQYAGQVQYLLGLLGYEVGTITVYLTPETVSTIRAFQADHGLPVDGLVTDCLIEAIEGFIFSTRLLRRFRI